MQKLFLYLASRSKQGIKLITVLQGETTVMSRLTELKRLNLPQTWEIQISKIIDENKMMYEPWVESAGSFQELKKRLQERGFTSVPMGAMPMLNFTGTPPKANTTSCNVQRTMIRKRW